MTDPDLYQQSRDVYDGMATTYALKDGEELVDEDLLDLFLRHLPAGVRVLDLGCGPGQYARRIVSAGHAVLAIDNSAEMISELQRRGLPIGLEARQMDMRELDGSVGVFGGIFAAASLIHVMSIDLPPVLRTLRDLVRQDGIMMANFAISDKGLRFERDASDVWASGGRFFQHYDNPEVPLTQLREAGWQLIDRSTRVVHPILKDGTAGRTEWANFVVRAA